MKTEEQKKLVHDINSGLCALEQALFAMSTQKVDAFTQEKMLSLSHSKVLSLISDWKALRETFSAPS